MQSVQRQYTRLTKKPGDNAKVSVLLSDYEDADKVLVKIIDNSKSWRDSWVHLLNSQSGIVSEYEGLYDPIVGASDGHGREAIPTPELQLHRTLKLKEAYEELKAELIEEVTMVDARIIKPATDARDYIQPVRKTIKKRENKRLDHERSQDKVAKLQKKPAKSAKDESAFAKAQEEMARTGEEFQIADAHLRETLPPIINAAFSIIPPLLSVHVLVQNRLLGLYYTTLHGYCEEHGFPSPPPPMDDVIAAWSALFKPVQQEVEAISCIATGKAVRMPMALSSDDGQARKPSASSIASAGSNGFRRTASGLIPGGANGAGGGPPPANGPRPNRIPSFASLSSSAGPSPRPSPAPSQSFRDHLAPTDFTTASRLGYGGGGPDTSPGASPSPQAPRPDYFSRSSTTSIASTASAASRSTTPTPGLGALAAAKKKPPPPPPKPRPRPNPGQPDEFVVALYAFPGQGQGDLAFSEGDRIRIVRKTQTDQDWWVGELGGRQGSFPANYCRAA